ncbi:MAG: DUF3343 domain-containing protein [Deltaproteobacteria bacterium]|nr:DUF3343 domain-containing protein [Deltaproteobacteria bacterium]MBI5810387.1 DUF3343 domain-containing protein [Deltaproteobacteria bacterium]
MEYLLSFGGSHRALKAEALLKKASLAFKLLPAPKALLPYCGLVIEVQEDVLCAAKDALNNARLKIKSIYRREGDGYVKV